MTKMPPFTPLLIDFIIITSRPHFYNHRFAFLPLLFLSGASCLFTFLFFSLHEQFGKIDEFSFP